jgi:hypothetical protein
VPVPPADAKFDLTGDGKIDGMDLDHWLSIAAAENGVAAPYVAGDADLSGEVTAADFLSLAENFASGIEWSQGNFDGNRLIDFADFALLADSFARTERGSAAVPEPSTFNLAGFAFAALVGVCLRRHRI